MPEQDIIPEQEIHRYFGVEIQRSSPEIANLPPAESAAQTIAKLVREGDVERFVAIDDAANQVSSVLDITEERDGMPMGLVDLFTADQILEMNRRITTYLGKPLSQQIQEPTRPLGYEHYVNRLGFHFNSAETIVTRQFGSFESNHTDPSTTGIGPREYNSRQYALVAMGNMERQFKGYYQSGIEFDFCGPTKVVDNSRVSERGIAECQFLVMDYVRDLLAQENATTARNQTGEVMTLADIEANIITLLTHRDVIIGETTPVSPMIAEQLNDTISQLNTLTVPSMHRGRPGVPKFRREPNHARLLIIKAESLLMQAEAMAVTRDEEEDIPILEL